MVIFLGRAVLATILIVAGSVKLIDLKSFSFTLMRLGIFTHQRLLLRGLSWIVPLLELAVGLALVSGLWTMLTTSAALLLMMLFTAVTGYALTRGVSVECRCFGALSSSSFTKAGLLRNVILTFTAAYILVGEHMYALRYEIIPLPTLLTVVGYMVFGIVAAQAAMTIAASKENMPS